MKKGIITGAIAGTISGIISFVGYQIYSIIGILEPKIYTIMFLASQVIFHIGFAALWGAVFGIIFAMTFDRIPGTIIKKGLWIGLFYCLFSVVRPTFFVVAYGMVVWGLAFILITSLDKFVYGILFAIFYKRWR